MIREKKNNREELSLVRLLNRQQEMRHALKRGTSFTYMLLNVWIIHYLEQKIIH